MSIWRKVLGCVAILAVLAHGAMLLQHASMVLAKHVAQEDIASAMGAICHSGDRAPSVPVGDWPSPEPDGASKGCPICMGPGSAVAILPERMVQPHQPDTTSARQAVVGEIIRLRMAAVRPPSTGPPLIA